MADAKAVATKAGIENVEDLFQKLLTLNWTDFFAFVGGLIAAFRSKPKPMMAKGASAHDCAAACKAHFDAITELSECGAQCCDGV